jgi:hypothetical protein
VRPRETFDSSATPKPGEKAEKPKSLKEVDLEALGAQIKATVTRAKENDPAALKRRIRELEKEVEQSIHKSAIKPDPELIDRVCQEGAAMAESYWRPAAEERDKVIARQQKILAAIKEALGVDGGNDLSPVPLRPRGRFDFEGFTVPRSVTKSSQVLPARRLVSQERPIVSHDGHLPPGERAVLEACIQYPAGLRREQLTVLTGYKRSSRDAYIARLAQKDFIRVVGESIFSTPTGEAALPDARPLPTGAELRRFWADRLPPGEKAMLEQLLYAYPEAVDREELTNQTGYKRSSRDAYLARLSAKHLVEDAGRGQVRATATIGEGGG